MILYLAPLWNTYLNLTKKESNFKVCYHAKLSKNKKIFGKVYTPNCFEEILLKCCFEIKAVKDTETSTYVVKDFYGETFTGVEKRLKK